MVYTIHGKNNKTLEQEQEPKIVIIFGKSTQRPVTIGIYIFQKIETGTEKTKILTSSVQYFYINIFIFLIKEYVLSGSPEELPS